MFTLFSKSLKNLQDTRHSAIRTFLSAAGAQFNKPVKRRSGLTNLAYSLGTAFVSRTSYTIRGSLQSLREEAGITNRDVINIFLTGINPVLGFLSHSLRHQMSGFDKVSYSIEESTVTISSKLEEIRRSIEEGVIPKILRKMSFLLNYGFGSLRYIIKGHEFFKEITTGFRERVTGKSTPSFIEAATGKKPSLAQRAFLFAAGRFIGSKLPDFLKTPDNARILEGILLRLTDKKYYRDIEKSFKEKGIFEGIADFVAKNVKLVTDEVLKKKPFIARWGFKIARDFIDEGQKKGDLKERMKVFARILSSEYRMLEYELAKGIVKRMYYWIGVRFPIFYTVLEASKAVMRFYLIPTLKRLAGIEAVKNTAAYIARQFEKAFDSVKKRILSNKFFEERINQLKKLLKPVAEWFNKIFKRFESSMNFLANKFGGMFKFVKEFLFGKKEDPVEQALNNIYSSMKSSYGIFQSIYDKLKEFASSAKEFFKSFSIFKAVPVFFKKITSEKQEDKSETEKKEASEKEKQTDESLKEKLEELKDNIESTNKTLEDKLEKIAEEIKTQGEGEKKRDKLGFVMNFLSSLFGKGLGLFKGFSFGIPFVGGGRGFSLPKGPFLRGLGILGAGYGVYDLTKKAIEGKESENRFLGTVGDALQGAATGAAIGSLIPGVGTAIGALAGGAAGLGVGVYRNFLKDNLKNVINSLDSIKDKLFGGKTPADVASPEVKSSEVKYWSDYKDLQLKAIETSIEAHESFKKEVVEKGSKSFDKFNKTTRRFEFSFSNVFSKLLSTIESVFSSIGSAVGGALSNLTTTGSKVASSLWDWVKKAFNGPSDEKNIEKKLQERLKAKADSSIRDYYGDYYKSVEDVTRERVIRESAQTLRAFKDKLNLDEDLINLYLGTFHVESGFNPFVKNPSSTASGLGQLIDETRIRMLEGTAKDFGIDIEKCKNESNKKRKIACMTKAILDQGHRTGLRNLIQLETYLAARHNKEKHDFIKSLPTIEDKWLYLRLYHAQPATADVLFKAYKEGKGNETVISLVRNLNYVERLAQNARKPIGTVTVNDVVKAFGATPETFGQMEYVWRALQKGQSTVAGTTSTQMNNSEIDIIQLANQLPSFLNMASYQSTIIPNSNLQKMENVNTVIDIRQGVQIQPKDKKSVNEPEKIKNSRKDEKKKVSLGGDEYFNNINSGNVNVVVFNITNVGEQSYRTIGIEDIIWGRG